MPQELKKFDPKQLRSTAGAEARPRLVYVEDDDANWRVAELNLRSRYQLIPAKTAEQFFALITRVKADLVLMDIELAGSDIDGIGIVEILSGKWKGLVPW